MFSTRALHARSSPVNPSNVPCRFDLSSKMTFDQQCYYVGRGTSQHRYASFYRRRSFGKTAVHETGTTTASCLEVGNGNLVAFPERNATITRFEALRIFRNTSLEEVLLTALICPSDADASTLFLYNICKKSTLVSKGMADMTGFHILGSNIRLMSGINIAR